MSIDRKFLQPGTLAAVIMLVMIAQCVQASEIVVDVEDAPAPTGNVVLSQPEALHVHWLQESSRFRYAMPVTSENLDAAIAAMAIAYDAGGAWRAFLPGSQCLLNRVSIWNKFLEGRMSPEQSIRFWNQITAVAVRLQYAAADQVGGARRDFQEPELPEVVVQWISAHHGTLSPVSVWHEQIELIDSGVVKAAAIKWLTTRQRVAQHEREYQQMPTVEDLQAKRQDLMRYCWMQLPPGVDDVVVVQCARALSDTGGWDEQTLDRLSKLKERGVRQSIVNVVSEIANTRLNFQP